MSQIKKVATLSQPFLFVVKSDFVGGCRFAVFFLALGIAINSKSRRKGDSWH